MPAALLHFSSLRRSQHNCVRAMPALKFQQNLRQNRCEHVNACSGFIALSIVPELAFDTLYVDVPS